MKNFFNKFTNNNRIFSYQDVINMPNDEGAFFKDAIDYQARTIGLPTNEQLQMSSDVVYVHAYTCDDGTEVRAHYRSKAGHAFANPQKPNIQTAQDAKKHIENWAGKVMEVPSNMYEYNRQKEYEKNTINMHDPMVRHSYGAAQARGGTGTGSHRINNI